MSTVNVTVKMDERLKRQAEQLFSDFGLTLNDAFVMFAEQAVSEQRVPLDIESNGVTIASDQTVADVSLKLIEQNEQSYKELAK